MSQLRIQTKKIAIVFGLAIVRRDSFREPRALRHLSVWDHTQVWPI